MKPVTEALLRKLVARLTATPGVVSVEVLPSEDGCAVRPLVVGGDPQDIGRMLFCSVPCGILTVGDQLVDVIDCTGKAQPVRFSRPESALS